MNTTIIAEIFCSLKNWTILIGHHYKACNCTGQEKSSSEKRITEETRKKWKIREKGDIPSRLSSRNIGVEPEVVIVTNANQSTRNIIKGDRDERYHAKDADWKYFVSSNKVLQLPGLSKEGSERNREVFVVLILCKSCRVSG